LSDAAATEYFRWFYDSGVWKQMHYRGIRVLKLPTDLWNYQEIFTEHDIDWVLETGSRHGGSALYFADLLQLNDARGKVISIDVDRESNWVGEDPRIEFWIGDSASPEMVERIRARLPADRGALFTILDSDHAKQHVLREMEGFLPLMRKGDYLVVEDGCVNGHPVRPQFGPGPWEAIEEFTARHPQAFLPDRAREQKFGITAAPNGYLVKT
jgi:cephalosporin hydroxylase